MASLSAYLAPVKLNRQKFTATGGQTVFTLTSITIPSADPKRVTVSINGNEQTTDAYTVDSSTQVTLSEGVEAGDIVNFTVPGY